MTASVRFGGITIDENPANPYVLSALSLPGVTSRQATTKRLTGGIAFVGGDVGEAGTLSLEAHILGSSPASCDGLINTFVAAWAPAKVDEEIVVNVGGGDRVYVGRALSCLPLPDGSATAAARCAFAVSDPVWYSAATKSVTLSVSSTTGGLTTPIDTTGGITTTGSGSTGDASIVNAGTAPAPWTAYLNGPLTTPRVILDGQTLELLGVVPAGSTLVVNSHNGTIRLDGASRPWKSFESVWWEIPPGTSMFSFRAGAGTGTATLIWQDASY